MKEVAVRSTDFASDGEVLRELLNNPLSFAHVTKSGLLDEGIQESDPDFFQKSVAYIDSIIANGYVVRDSEEAFYIYRQGTASGTYTGVIGLCDISDYESGKIKKHEHTRTNREAWVARLVDETRVIGEPVLLGHDENDQIEQLIQELVSYQPDSSFMSQNGYRHELWRVTGDRSLQLKALYESNDSVYIMDGHHRSASFSRLHEHVDGERYRMFQCMMLSPRNIRIWPFHRFIHLEYRTPDQFLNELSAEFKVRPSDKNLPVWPDKKGTFGVYLHGNWFELVLEMEDDRLDVLVLEERVLKGILGIEDSRTDERLDFVSGNKDGRFLEQLVDQAENNVLITLNPCTFEDIKKVSDEGRTMPPKSTYIEPKGRSGMVIQKF